MATEAVARVQTVHAFQRRASVWNELHVRFMAKVSNGELPASDGRSSEALQRKYNEELSYYRRPTVPFSSPASRC